MDKEINWYTRKCTIKRSLGIILIPALFIGGIIILIFDKESTSWKELTMAIKDFWNGNYSKIF